MSSPPTPPPPLHESLRRVREAVARGQATRADLVRSVVEAAGAHAIDRVSQKLEQKLQRRQERQQRKEARRAARLARRQALGHQGPRGLVVAFAILAAALVGAGAIAHVPALAAVAAGLVIGGVLLSRRAEDALPSGESSAPRLESNPVVTASEPDRIAAREQRVAEVGTKLLAELKKAPQAVRDFVRQPEETVQALLAASKELARRERELRVVVPEADQERLSSERALLAARVDAEPDAVVKGRLGAALAALDAQLAQRRELATAAARFEAEGTRLLYTLENLHTQVLRARAADSASSDVVGAGLKQGLEQVSQELDAIADALEQTHQERPPAVVDVSGAGGDGSSHGGVKVR